MAERTGQGATDLRRNTQRPPVGFGDIDHLNLVATRDPDKVFAGAIGADLFGDNLGQADHKIIGQQRAIVFGQIGHQGKIAHAPMIQPLPDLPHPHFRLFFRGASGNQRVAQPIPGQPDQVDRTIRQDAFDGQQVLGNRGHGRPLGRVSWGHIGKGQRIPNESSATLSSLSRKYSCAARIKVLQLAQRLCASSTAAVNPDRLNVSLVIVPRPD